MRFLKRLVVPALLCATACLSAQSAANLQTLADLKIAAKQMQLEVDGMVPFRLNAKFATYDFSGMPDNQGQWTEEFVKPGISRRTLTATASEVYAAEDDVNSGPVKPAMVTGSFMQRFLLDAFLAPGPSDVLLDHSKISYKAQTIGNVSLRCVVLEPAEKSRNTYEQRAARREYCLGADRPVIRRAVLNFGIQVTYNSLARFGPVTFAEQITASQGGRSRGTLEVQKLVTAPELSHASLPRENPNADPAGVVKVRSELMASKIRNKVQPVYPLEAKRSHTSGTVLLHAILSKEGRVESLEVISAPSDDLAESAAEAVSQWTYEPFLLNGLPREVETTVVVNYQLVPSASEYIGRP